MYLYNGIFLSFLFLFLIANRALNFTLEMNITLYASACAEEDINNLHYENLTISVFSPLAIQLYLCPLSGRI